MNKSAHKLLPKRINNFTNSKTQFASEFQSYRINEHLNFILSIDKLFITIFSFSYSLFFLISF